MTPADDGDRDRLADECALLAEECADLRDVVTAHRNVIAAQERELARAMREIAALELERAQLVGLLARGPGAATATDAGTVSGEHGRAGSLVIGLDGVEPCYFLDGHPLHVGDVIELCTIDGTWIAGRYDWSARDDDLPKLCGAIVGVEIPLTERAPLRWPSRVDDPRLDESERSA